MVRRLLSRQRGQALIEFVVIFPLIAFFVFAIIDGGLLMGRYNNISNATKEGARLAATGATRDQILDRVQKQVHGNLDDVTTNCTPDADGNEICVEWIEGPTGEAPGDLGSSVRVRVKYHYPFLTPIVNWLGGDWQISACAVQRLERQYDADDIGTGDSCSGSN